MVRDGVRSSIGVLVWSLDSVHEARRVGRMAFRSIHHLHSATSERRSASQFEVVDDSMASMSSIRMEQDIIIIRSLSIDSSLRGEPKRHCQQLSQLLLSRYYCDSHCASKLHIDNTSPIPVALHHEPIVETLRGHRNMNILISKQRPPIITIRSYTGRVG